MINNNSNSQSIVTSAVNTKQHFLQNEGKQWRSEDDHCLWSNRDCSVSYLALHHFRPSIEIRERLQELSVVKSSEIESDPLIHALLPGVNDTTNSAEPSGDDEEEHSDAGDDSQSTSVSARKHRKRSRNESIDTRLSKKRRIEKSPTKLIENDDPPEAYCDPITFQLMKEPTMVTLTGYTYERETILQCIRDNGEDPFTRQQIDSSHLVVNRALKAAIDKWKEEHP